MKWTNFTREEFACQCGCGTNEIQDAVIDFCQELRDTLGTPLTVSSGYRCPEHPIEAAKAKPGTHARGLAADLLVSHGDARKVLKAALELNRGGVGVHQRGDGRFIHVDVDPSRVNLLWTY
jgi:uncharacterized protein YcbK (DUF882 family)